jgi:hypothetical protein
MELDIYAVGKIIPAFELMKGRNLLDRKILFLILQFICTWILLYDVLTQRQLFASRGLTRDFLLNSTCVLRFHVPTDMKPTFTVKQN